jgi:tetratricopeptide (TPR) repeat protein
MDKQYIKAPGCHYLIRFTSHNQSNTTILPKGEDQIQNKLPTSVALLTLLSTDLSLHLSTIILSAEASSIPISSTDQNRIELYSQSTQRRPSGRSREADRLWEKELMRRKFRQPRQKESLNDGSQLPYDSAPVTDQLNIAVNVGKQAFAQLKQGNYAKAESLFIRALAITEAAVGPDHLKIAERLNDLANLYQSQGLFSKAEPLYIRALDITQGALGADGIETVSILNNLAVLNQAQGYYTKAELIYIRALKITENTLGQKHEETPGMLNNLAGIYHAQGAYAKAEPLLIRALAINQKDLGSNHINTAINLNNLAVTYHALREYGRAEHLYDRALAIREHTLGHNHPVTARSVYNLARLLQDQGAYAKAIPLSRRGIAADSHFLQTELPLLPQTFRLAQVETLGGFWELAFTGTKQSPRAAELALFSRLNRYGLLLEIERRQGLKLRARGPQREQAQQLAFLLRQLVSTDLPPQRRQALQQQRVLLERKLYQALPALKPRILEPSQLADALPHGAVYLAFQRYRPFDGQKKYESRWSAPRYLALMLSKGGSAEVVDLGPSDLIDTLIRTALATTSSSGVTPDEIQAAWSSVNHELFPPSLQAKLQGSSRWILSPDGELSRIPFLALPSPLASTGSEQRLADIIDIQLVSSGRDLVSDPARTASQQAATPLVVANPSFGPSPHGPWKPLEASGREGQKIASILGVTPKLLDQQQSSADRRSRSGQGAQATLATNRR